MKDHEAIRELVPLAAAGVLSPDEQLRVEDHARLCPECAAYLSATDALAAGLRELPVPMAPPGLAARTANRVLAVMAEAADRRWDNAVLVFLTLFAWTVGLTVWAIVRLLGGGVFAIMDVGFAQTLVWLAASTVLVWMTAGVAAVVLSRQRRPARRSL